MYQFALLPGTGNADAAKNFLLRLHRNQPHNVELYFYGQATTTNNGQFIFQGGCGIQVPKVRIHYFSGSGGRERFYSDMVQLKEVLIDAGGFFLNRCEIGFPNSCADREIGFPNSCADLIPDAIGMICNASPHCRTCKELRLFTPAVVDPLVVAAIVENWRIDSKAGGSCHFVTTDISRHGSVLEAIFNKPGVIDATLVSSTNLIGAEVLVLLSSLLSSSASRVTSLKIATVLACAESDRLLASVLKTNKSLKRLRVRFDSNRSWVTIEMARAMREVNCTLVDHIQIFPVPNQGSLAYACQAEIDVYTALNRCGRGCLRRWTFRPQKIPFLLKEADHAEDGNVGRYLYPLLRENPAKWAAYLVRRDK